MPRKKLGLIHTSSTLIDVFKQICDELIPGVDVMNITDESLIADVIAAGNVTESVSQRLREHVRMAEASGADLIMVTCSSIGCAAEAAQAWTSVPVLRVDRAMADHAVSQAARIGVVATLYTTLGPTVELIEHSANLAGKSVEVTARLCDGAFAELVQGNLEAHDNMVCQALAELIQTVDVIVLAQASMSRCVARLPAELTIKPILSSPRLAVESIQRKI
jgi:aspartate/glutamate racemase